MSKKRKNAKKKRNRLIDVEVDEFSAVDKPAIEEVFYFTKSQGDNMKDLIKKLMKAQGGWVSAVKKSDQKDEEICVFCKEVGGQEPQIGLLQGVCFTCACERMEKGVMDACLNGTFSFEEYKKNNPEEFEEENPEEENPEEENPEEESPEEENPEEEDPEEENPEEENPEEEEKRVPPADASDEDKRDAQAQRAEQYEITALNNGTESLSYPEGEPTDEDMYGDPVNLKFPLDSKERVRNAVARFPQAEGYNSNDQQIIADRIASRAKEEGIQISSDTEIWDFMSQGARDLFPESQETAANTPVEGETLKSEVGNLRSMVEETLSLHEIAAGAFNQMFEINLAMFESLIDMTQKNSEINEETKKSLEDVSKAIADEKGELSKAGAKLSKERLLALKDIADKINDIIAACGGSLEKTEKSEENLTKAISEQIAEMGEKISKEIGDLKKSSESIVKRIDDLEEIAGSSSSIDDEDDEDDDEEDKPKNVFKGLFNVEKIRESIRYKNEIGKSDEEKTFEIED